MAGRSHESGKSTLTKGCHNSKSWKQSYVYVHPNDATNVVPAAAKAHVILLAGFGRYGSSAEIPSVGTMPAECLCRRSLLSRLRSAGRCTNSPREVSKGPSEERLSSMAAVSAFLQSQGNVIVTARTGMAFMALTGWPLIMHLKPSSWCLATAA